MLLLVKQALVYAFFIKTNPRELVSQLTETNMTENLDWHVCTQQNIL